jgi:transposase
MRMETYIRKSLGMKAHWVTEVVETEEGWIARVDRLGNRRLRCGHCRGEAKMTRGRRPERSWRDLSIRDKVFWIVYRPFRVLCPRCGLRVEGVPWARKWQRVTQALAQAVALLAKKLSFKEVAEYFRLDWKVVATVIKRVVEEGLKLRKIKTLHILGIDEVSRKKGHRYLTLVYDLERGKLLWVGLDRKQETLDEFFRWLGRRKARTLEAICLDMWAPYMASVQQHVPQASLVFDRFHVVQHLNRAIDEVRRAEVRRLAHQEGIDLKKTRFILLKNPWNLNPKEHRRLSHLLKLNLPVVRAYYLKEEFQRFWDYLQEKRAQDHLRQWLWWATHSRLQPIIQFARLVKDHLPGLLAWTKLRISNGALEGMNNKIKLVSHRSFGFRKPDYFIAAIYHCCAGLPLNISYFS